MPVGVAVLGRVWPSRPRVTFSLSLAGRTLVDLLRAYPWALLVAGRVAGLALGGGGHRASPRRGRTAAKHSKARSPRLYHAWNACRREERRRRGEVLSILRNLLERSNASRRSAPRWVLYSAAGHSFYLKARPWPLSFAGTLRIASCCLRRPRTINRAGTRARVSAGPWRRQDDWKGLRDGRKPW